LKRLGISRKKVLKYPRADEPLRIEFEANVEQYKSKVKSVSHIDESGFSHESTRSLSLPNAITEPANVTAPIKMPT